MRRFIAASAILGVVSGCGSDDKLEPLQAETVAVDSVPASGPTKESLERRANELNELSAAYRTAEAFGMYSQRCQDKIGSLQTYELILKQFYKDREPQFDGVVAKVNGSSGQVVTVDDDPNAPSWSMDPKTWTFIDGTWVFDNC